MAEDTFPTAAALDAAIQALEQVLLVQQSYPVLRDALVLYQQAAASYEALRQARDRLALEGTALEAANARQALDLRIQAEDAQRAHEELMAGYRVALRQTELEAREAQAALAEVQAQVTHVEAGLAHAIQAAEAQVEHAVQLKLEALDGSITRLEQVRTRLEADNAGLRQQQDELRAGVAAMQRRYEVAQRQFAVVDTPPA